MWPGADYDMTARVWMGLYEDEDTHKGARLLAGFDIMCLTLINYSSLMCVLRT